MVPSKKTKIIMARKEWTRSTSERKDLEEMVMEGNLPNKAMTRHHPTTGEQYPDPRDGELVIF
jgi:hypothetical protein